MSTETPSRDLIRLTNLMNRLKKSTGSAPFILLLGTDAAPISMESLEYEVLVMDGLKVDNIHSMNVSERNDTFRRTWGRLGTDIRFACLNDAFTKMLSDSQQTQKLEGYRGLARLIKSGYFDMGV